MESSSAGGLNNMALTLLSTQSGTNQTTMSFTSGIDSTYLLYLFRWTDVNPATDSTDFQFQVNASGQSGYNETMNTNYFKAAHDEADSATALAYQTSHDQANGTAFQNLAAGVGNGSDESTAGELYLFEPSNTTYKKNFCSRANHYHGSNESEDCFSSGYINVTAAVTNVQFKMASGNFDGTIKMYGVA